MGRLFGTDGARGVANAELTCETAMAIGRAAAMVLLETEGHRPRVVIGKDTRISSDMLEAALVAGFCSVGADVSLLGVVPTPAVAYLVKQYGADAGVMISGLLGGLGGLVYITAGVSEWKFENGVAGFGFLALAVMIFGQWKPIRIALAALLFGLFRALSNVYFGFGFLMSLGIPGSVYNMLPYIISLLVLAFTSKSSRAPKAEGIPYDKAKR